MQLVLILERHVLHALLFFLLDEQAHLELLALHLEALVEGISPILPFFVNQPISGIGPRLDREETLSSSL